MVAVVNLMIKVTLQAVLEVAGVPQPLVHQVLGLLEATVVQAPPSPSQETPPHSRGEVGVQELASQARGAQGEGGPAVSFSLQTLPLVRPTLAVGAGEVSSVEHQVAPAL
jgi:hypothetical protein